MRQTIEVSGADVVIVATPIDPGEIVPAGKQSVRARYAYADVDEPRLAAVLDRFLAGQCAPHSAAR